MSSSEITTLKLDLSDFIVQMGTFFRVKGYDHAAADRLELRYCGLYEQFRYLDEDTINREFSAEHIEVISLLLLGNHHVGEFYRETASFFSEDADKSAEAVDRFVMSANGVNLVTPVQACFDEDDEAVVRIFGELVIAEVLQDFVTSRRAEELCRIWVYSKSGLCEDDMKRWNDAKANPALREKHGTIDRYLHNTIRKADKRAFFRIEDRGGHCEATMEITEFEGASVYPSRVRNVVDHCFVRHNPKGGGVIALATSTAQARKDGYDIAEAVSAAKALAATKTMNGEHNPFYGHEVQHYCFF
jgi:hypothetical protein